MFPGPPDRRGIGLLHDSPKTPEYEKLGPTRILPHLYIGCAKDALSAETRQAHSITHIVNVSSNCERPSGFPDERFLRIPVNDGYIDNLQPHFSRAHDFINKVKSEQGKVMVHCQGGISRSAALTISYIMKSRRISCEQAYRFVKMMRPIVSPNFNFLGQLLDYEKELNLTASPTTSSAGTKRKRLNMSLPLTGASSVTDSPQHSKRLVVNNNNSISSLSPASALAGLKFEQSISPQTSCPLPGPNPFTEESTIVGLRHPPHHLSIACELPPPKRCHSWNGLADLASASTSSTNTLSPKLRKLGGSPNRPRSLNLSMSNLSVPPAVLELNAKVDCDLSRHKRMPIYGGSADNILEISEESEGSLSHSNSGTSLSHQDLTDSTPRQQRLIFEEIENTSQIDQQVLLVKESSASNPSLSPATPTVRPYTDSNPLNDLTMSQPLLKTFQSSLEQLKTSITSAHTAPSDLSKVVILNDLSQEVRRRSHSLGNLVSPCDEKASHSSLCMKCGRTDKLNLCHVVTTPTATANYIGRPRSMHDSLEMIQVL